MPTSTDIQGAENVITNFYQLKPYPLILHMCQRTELKFNFPPVGECWLK